jgi:hypothetical protein
VTDRNGNASIPKSERPERRDGAARAEGAEMEVARLEPADHRDGLDEYLRLLEKTRHYEPIREVCGPTQ